MLPQRPPLHSMNNNSNGQQQQSVPPVPIPSRSTTRRPRRQRYNTVAVSEEDEDDHQHNVHTTTTRTNEYNVVDIERASVVSTIINDDDEDDDNNNITGRNRNHHRTQRQPLYAALPTSTSSSSSSSSSIILMDVTILDFTHKRWPIQITTNNITTTTTVNNSSTGSNHGTNQYEPTVYDLKHIGATVHNIPIVQQRLIYQGKLLNDDSLSLISLGIQKSGSIVHLFPKPRVVVVDTSNNNSNTNETPATNTTNTNNNNNSNEPDNNNEGNGGGGGGAHVPVIVMEQSEVDRRSEILVLGHADYVEAVSNVKLFSLMLLIISTIELLHLLSLYITPPQSSSSNSNSYYNSNSYNGDGPNNAPRVHEDDNFFNDDQYNGTSSASKNSSNVIDTITAGANAIDPIEMILDQWTPIKYVDLIISILGIYVSILGMRASNENCIRTARYYLIGTTLTAIAWLAYNYIISYEIDVEVDAHPEKYYENSESSDYNYGSSATTNDDVIGETYSSSNSNGSNSGYYNSNDSPYNQAFSAMILPGMVWGLCIYRAWQFQHVLYDAELEAAERTNTMMSIDETHDNNNNNNNNNSGMNQTLGDVELSAMSILRRHHNNTTGSNNNTDDTTTSDGNSTNPSPTVRMIT